MRILLILLVCLVACSCATSKKESSSAQVETKGKQKTQVNSKVTSDTQTKHFGDSLRGRGFVPGLTGQSGNPLRVESSGVLMELYLNPQFAADGTYLGSWIDYKSVAKPKAVTDEKTTLNTETKIKASTEIEAEVAEDHLTRKTPGLTYVLLGAGIILLLLLILLIWYLKSRILK